MPDPISIPGKYQQAILDLMAGNCVRMSDTPLIARCAVLLEAGYRLREMIDLTTFETATADIRRTDSAPLSFPQNFDPTPKPPRKPKAPKEDPPILEQPLIELDCNLRTYNRLKKQGIVTIGQLCDRTALGLIRIQGFGQGGLLEVRQRLAAKGLRLKGESISEKKEGDSPAQG